MISQDTLVDRYGAPSPWRRRAVVGGCALVVLVFLSWLGWTAWDAATPEVRSEMVGFDVVDEHTATATVDVRLDDGVAATCTLRAYAEDHVSVGDLTFEPDAADQGAQTVTVRTERRATSVELIGCTTPDQSRPR